MPVATRNQHGTQTPGGNLLKRPFAGRCWGC